MSSHSREDGEEPLPDWSLRYKHSMQSMETIVDEPSESTPQSWRHAGRASVYFDNRSNSSSHGHDQIKRLHSGSTRENRYLDPTARLPSRSKSQAKRLSRRLSNRLSQSSEHFYEGFEFQGWRGPTSPTTHISDGIFRLEQLENSHKVSEDPKKGDVVVTVTAATADEVEEPPKKYGSRTWLVMFALCVTQLLNAFEGTVTSTALPTIVADLNGGEEFIWITSGYFLTSTVFQPLFGQTADIFGRKWLTIFAVAAFVLGSGICGGAPTIGVLILGRVIQGIGGGGINVLVNVIVSDMFAVRDRGKFLAIVLSAVSVGTSIGPILGGVIVQSTTWRWVFYLNLPVGGVALILLFAFLEADSGKRGDQNASMKEKLGRIDYGGNVLFITGVTLVLVALAYGGNMWAWTSYSTLLSLLVGFFILVIFLFYEESNYCKEPTLPLRLFRNRTSATAYAITFLHSLLTLHILYFLPVYFQAVKLANPTESGVDMLPTVLLLVPSSVISGALLSKFGRYKPFHILAFGLLVLALGLFTRLRHDSPAAMWAILQIIAAVGSGLALSTLLPAAQACLADSDTASATAAWAFLRSFGIVWGVAVPSAIFSAQATNLVAQGIISDPDIAATLGTGGGAYEHATADWIKTVPTEGGLRDSVISLFEQSLEAVWIFGVAVAALAFLLAFLEREVALRQKLQAPQPDEANADDSANGIQNRKRMNDEVSAGQQEAV
ncbi:major facilitator superfamily domain-containing protein [Xylaria intraflava]|nr:major facilitator superfamily domain-containing protein [Xylaria intraflava]